MHKALKNQITTYIRHLQTADQRADIQITRLTPDGSDRLYYRVTAPGIAPFIAADASQCKACDKSSGLSQNNTFRTIQQHLENLNFPVPKYLSADSNDDDLYLLQDLGDTTLHSFVQQHGWQEQTLELYRKALSLLLRLQVEAVKNFKPQWAYAGGFYDYELIIERELNYFLKAFVIDFCRIEPETEIRQRLAEEFKLLADTALRAPANFFLYRDFQSKNLMLHQNKIYLIDFQGARLGPCYYDPAALINDPYVEMPLPLRRQLSEFYFRKLQSAPTPKSPGAKPLTRETFDLNFTLFSLIRTLQTLGAFGYLSGCGKKHFTQYIRPALTNLHLYLNRLQEAGFDLKALHSISREIELRQEEQCRR